RPLIEIGCTAMRLPFLNRVARHIFFGRNSFPDVEMNYVRCGSPHCPAAVSGPEFWPTTKD
ncbi:MAG TPA: hypothetical protein VJS17_03875, partial [Pyrinomonadaceae bacterium]|nr:hypothetical protein [Pyrinomonadaceae bacterium]